MRGWWLRFWGRLWARNKPPSSPKFDVIMKGTAAELGAVICQQNYLEGRYTEAEYIQQLRRYIALAGDKEADTRGFAAACLAVVMVDRGDLTEAEQLYRMAIASRHETATILSKLNLGLLLMQQHRYEEARNLMQDVIASQDPVAAPKALVNLGWMLFEQGRTQSNEYLMQQGMELLQQVVITYDNDETIAAMLQLGSAHILRGEYNLAQNYLNSVVRSGHPEFVERAEQIMSESGMNARIVKLLGTWVLDDTDEAAYEDAFVEFGNVSQEFRDDGWLIYIVRGGPEDITVKFRYAVEGATIVSHHPSQGDPVRTNFAFTPDGALILSSESRAPTRYKRFKPSAER